METKTHWCEERFSLIDCRGQQTEVGGMTDTDGRFHSYMACAEHHSQMMGEFTKDFQVKL